MINGNINKEIPMYSYNNNFPVEDLPHSIRLANGMTKTDSSTFTTEEIEYAGYRYVDLPPQFDHVRQRVTWCVGESGIADWKVVDIPVEEKWQEVRDMRRVLMDQFEWRINRYKREQELGIPFSDIGIIHMYAYMQALADITEQPDPFAIQWPQYYPEPATQQENDV